MTKQEERAVLAKIEKIINEAGKDSYIGITFDGMIALCEENITNDWGCNPIKDLDTARERIAAMQRIENENGRTISQLNDACREHMQETADADERYKAEHLEHLETAGNINQTVKKLETANETIKGLQAEIVTLKAKLYDLMTQ